MLHQFTLTLVPRRWQPTNNRTFYDASGRVTGTATTSGDTTTFRDSAGRLTGTAERLPDGRLEFRDAQGRLTGTGK
jgi:YD repeat-containing protein